MGQFRSAIYWESMVLERRWRDNAPPAPKDCTNSRHESNGRSVGGTATH